MLRIISQTELHWGGRSSFRSNGDSLLNSLLNTLDELT